MQYFLGTMAAAVLVSAVSTASAQQSNCTQRAEFLDHLAANYAEKPKAVGLADSGNVVELVKSDDGNNWTIIATTPDGMACRIAAGKYWEPVSQHVVRGPDH